MGGKGVNGECGWVRNQVQVQQSRGSIGKPYVKVAGAATGVQAGCPLVLASLLSAKDWVQAGLACSI